VVGDGTTVVISVVVVSVVVVIDIVASAIPFAEVEAMLADEETSLRVFEEPSGGFVGQSAVAVFAIVTAVFSFSSSSSLICIPLILLPPISLLPPASKP
jgi:hypothetical protein